MLSTNGYGIAEFEQIVIVQQYAIVAKIVVIAQCSQILAMAVP
jgi:hypothetical protein